LSVIRGYFIPVGRERVVSVSRGEAVSIVERTLNAISSFLRKDAEKVLGKDWKFENISEAGKLRKLCDFMVFVFNLMVYPFKNIKVTFLKGKLSITEELSMQFFGFNNEEKLYSLCKKLSDILAFQNIPADTRPGANTSSLWNHHKVTSAVAYCLAIERKVSDSRLREILRFASLFHDIGKPLHWSSGGSHPSRSEELIRKHFTGILNDEILKKVCYLIKYHHDPDKISKIDPTLYSCAKILHDADVFASAEDRVEELAVNILRNYREGPEELNNKISKLDFQKWKDYVYWNNFSSEEIKRLTKYFLEKYAKYFMDEKDKYTSFRESKGELALIVCDARRIKDYVDHVNTLYEMIGGSRIVRLATINIRENVNELEKRGVLGFILEHLLPENIIFVGGGNLLLIAPASKASQITKEIEKTFLEATNYGTKMLAEYVTFPVDTKDTFGAIYSYLQRKLASKKVNLLSFEEPTIAGTFMMCESCGRKPASTVIRHGDKEYKVCESCEFKFKIGKKYASELRFKDLVLFEKLIEEAEKKKVGNHREEILQALMECIPEFIAGHSLEEVYNIWLKREEKKEVEVRRRLNWAIIKADGNLMGEFFARSISITDIYEKSLSIDRNLRVTLNEIFSKYGEENEYQILRLKFGLIYADGDDVLWLVPSNLAIDVAISLINKFNEESCHTCSLSVGIAVSDPVSPVYISMDVAESLLAQAKKLHRLMFKNKKDDKVAGYIDFEVVEAGTLSGFGLKSLRNKLSYIDPVKEKIEEKYPIIGRPYLIPLINETTNEFKLLNRNFFDLYYLGTALKNEGKYKINIGKEKEVKLLKDRRNVFNPNKFPMEKRLAVAFAVRQFGRHKAMRTGQHWIYRDVLHLLNLEDYNALISLLDAYVLLKILGGGTF